MAMPQDSRLSLERNPISFHQSQNLYPDTDTRNYSTKSFQWHLSFPPNLLHRGHNLTCDRLLMLPGTITGPIVVQQ